MKTSKKFTQGVVTFFIFSFIIFFTSMILALQGVDVNKLKRHYPHFSHYQGKSLFFTLKNRPPKNWVFINDLSETTKGSFILSEDWAFYEHPGLDLKQLKKVMQNFIEKGSFGRGASTITQQVVKNVFLTHERSIFRKLQEMYLAFILERHYSKDKILEVYLNIVELGDHIVGVGSAARHYFKKGASQLTPREAAFLTMLLPNPKNYSLSYRQKSLTPFARKRINQIGIKLRQGGYLSEEQRREYFSRPFSWEK